MPPKKGKKDDKGPPEDVFDPLLVESRQAATVVLMLESPEDDVQSKACEAIYKFVNKCEENRKVLYDLNACEQLFRLMKSEERVVRRNAVMALGVLTMHQDVRKYIRKTENAVPGIIKLLNTEEFSTTLEFATLALCNLSAEFTSIAAILDSGGMEPLVECLKSEDPDVQKNSIECISLLLQDFEARSIIRDCSGLEAMLGLLNSEYPVIQEQSLIAFIRATQDSGNRAVIREIESIKLFVDIIGNPAYNDVHVHALHVLANVLDDIECLQQMKESGGLARLVAFITDVDPPAEESKTEKGGKGKGGKGSAKGKKGKGDDDGKGEEKVPSHTMPEVKMHTCRAIMRSARNEDNRKVLHEADAEKMLIILLNHEDESVKVASAEALAVMAESSLAQDTIAKFEGIEPIVRMVKNDGKEIKEAGALAVANLTTRNMNNCHEVASHHGVEHLIGCLGVENERIQGNALTALTNMSTDEQLRQKVVSHGFVAAIIQPLKSESIMVQSKAALAVAAFVTDLQPRTEFRVSNGLEPLVALLQSNHSDVRRSACWTVTVLAVDQETAEELYKLNAVKILQDLNQSETKANRFSEAALNRLYDNNVTAKYALTGYLGFIDRIGEEFFDPGQMKPNSKLLSIGEYGLQPINNRRPIFLINAVPEKQDTMSHSMADTELKPPSEDKSSSRRPSKGTVKARTAKGKKEKPSTTVEEDLVIVDPILPEPEPPMVYQLPTDANLLKYIQDVQNNVFPITSTKEQLSALGRFVSDKMGGPIDRGNLMSFSCDLPISQLKFNLKCNVIPLGLITTGIHIHRALLFKFLADRIHLPVSLVRGEYNRAWNEIWLSDSNDSNVRFPPSLFIIDLIHEPGTLLRSDSIDAANYIQI